MPTSNTSSPVKRPGLGRRAVSSHAVVTRSSSSTTTTTQGELSHSHSSNPQKLPHRPHRPHLVGGGHRNHHRNPSFGKNLNKLQRHQSSHQIGTTTEGSARVHQRKKSAPATPAASPRGHHVRWDGVLDEPHRSTGSMKKNYSSPALRRNTSAVLGKKALVTDRPHTSSGKKKTVGFELADSDNDDADWEDTTQSPESTRRSSVAQSKESVENPAVLVDPLTFVKRSYPQFPRATSLPESTSKSFGEDNLSDDDQDDDDDNNTPQQRSDSEERHEDAGRALDHPDIAARLLTPSHSAKAPPAMSSISATVKPTAVESLSRNASLTNLASGPDGARRPLSSSHNTLAHTPGTQAQATSSSIEGGVSKFIINNKTGPHAFSRTDSDPNTPSSFLPHYHPQTPPSPRGTSSRKLRASPPSRPQGAEPHSRTQQKLWLQRTAALNTSPPDNHGVAATVSPSAIDPAYIAVTHARPGAGPFEPGRALVNGPSRTGGAVHDNEVKHIRKAYEKTTLELTVVRRFQSPTGDSFNRLNMILNDLKGGAASSSVGQRASLGKPIKSAPALTLLQEGTGRHSASPEPRQLIGKRDHDMHTSVSQAYLQDPDDLVNESDAAQGQKSQHPSHRILSTSDEPVHGSSAPEDITEDTLRANEAEMMIRRMWDSREVATAG